MAPLAKPACAQAPAEGKAFYVSAHGSATASGSAEQPFLTLEQARDAVRKELAAGGSPGGITVWIGDGTYFEPHGFELDQHQSGTQGSPVTYRSVPGETARIVGGMRVDTHSLRRVQDPATLARIAANAQGHVYALKLPAAAQTTLYPDIFHGNGGLFNVLFDDRTLSLSRWPKSGYTTIETVIDSGITPERGGTFLYRDEAAAHVQRWVSAAHAGELWLTGFWRVPFEVETVRVGHLDPAKRQITLAAPVPKGIGSKYSPLVDGTRHGNGKEQYYALNLLEEISQPGEWSYDFKARTLYLWPPDEDDLGRHEIILATATAPVLKLNLVHDVRLMGLTIEGGIHEGIQVVGGQRDLIAGNDLHNIGSGGVDVEGGSEVTVQSNNLSHLGSYGIYLIGGERKKLVAGRHRADNNHIWNIGEQDRITDGIFLDGVGNEATHNLIHDAPYNGVRYQGNDQRMAFNEIHHIGLDAGDLGVFYTNGDWAAQGNRVEHNFGHDAPNANGTYIDDGATGRTASDNVFYKLASGVFLGGGHNNQIVGNLIVDCRIGIHIDNRGESRKYDQSAAHLTRFLQTVDVNKAPWSTRYPHFLDSVLVHPTEPLGNITEHNLIAGAKIPFQVDAPAIVDASKNASMDASSVTFDPTELAFHSTDAGFRSVSVAYFGLYIDAYRKRLPTDAETGRFVDRFGTTTFDSNIDIKASNKDSKP